MIDTTLNIPIQLISSCSTLGDFTPLKFRFEDEEHHIVTVNISDILSTREHKINGIHELIYTCRAYINGASRLFELKYNVNTHKWLIFRTLA